MDVWFEKKNHLIEGLLTVTHRILEACRAGEWRAMETELSNRSQLLDQIEKCDVKILEAPSRFDSYWRAQLGLVRAIDQEIVKLIEHDGSRLGKRLVQLQDMKLELIKEFEIEPRGQRLKVEA